MPKIAYVERNFNPATLRVIAQADGIIAEYAAQGFDLTLRQLYYQFVARAFIRNRQTEYDRLGSIVNDARLAGLLDWSAIVDRTRNIQSLSHWDAPADIIKTAAGQYRIDKWADQPIRPEVWIEKDALVGVIEGVCDDNDVPYFSCRGYTSQSEMWAAAQRLETYIDRNQAPIIIHLGDHDPSGIDMTRDIEDRLTLFIRGDGYEDPDLALRVHRVALNFDQVQRYNPPPNPAKVTDSRYEGYQRLHGDESWELDALDPATLAGVIRDAIEDNRDADLWKAQVEAETVQRDTLKAISARWYDVAALIEKKT